jgi:hypothetical protein
MGEKIGKLEAAIAEKDKEIKILQLKCRWTLANSLCPYHRDKQVGKPCLACEIETKDEQIALYLRTNKNNLNTIKVLGERIAALKEERDLYKDAMSFSESKALDRVAVLETENKRLREALESFADFILEECDEWSLAHDAARNAREALQGGEER